VFRYALNNYDSSVIAVNPIPDLREVLEKRASKSLAAVTDPKFFGLMMRAIDSDEIGFENVRDCLQLLARTALRPGELRQGLWTEIDFERAEFRVPASRMKMRREHLVPLSTQAMEILRRQHLLTGGGALIFPGLRSGRPISDAAMGLALKTAFFDSKTHTAHGFRSSFSTMLHESGADPAVVELQLSHAKRDKIAGVYDRSQRVPERRALMQTWSDMIEGMKKVA
jgi:integrase